MMGKGQSTRISELDRVLRPIFIAFQVPKDTDAEALLAGYHFALDGVSVEAVENVVCKLVRGEIPEHLKFSPRPPELAFLARNEQRSLDAMRAPRIAPPKAVKTVREDPRVVQREKADFLEKLGYVMIDDNIDNAEFHSRITRRLYPSGSQHFWALGEVWCPCEVAHEFAGVSGLAEYKGIKYIPRSFAH